MAYLELSGYGIFAFFVHVGIFIERGLFYCVFYSNLFCRGTVR